MCVSKNEVPVCVTNQVPVCVCSCEAGVMNCTAATMKQVNLPPLQVNQTLLQAYMLGEGG